MRLFRRRTERDLVELRALVFARLPAGAINYAAFDVSVRIVFGYSARV